MIRSFLISLGTTLFVSTGLAISGYFFHISFWGVFVGSFILQVLGFYFWNSYMILKNIKVEQEVNLETLKELSKQIILVKCAYCKHENYLPVRLDIDNECKCEQCKKISSIFITVETAQKTIPGPTTLTELPGNVLAEITKSEV